MTHISRAITLLVILVAGFAFVRCTTSQLSLPIVGLVRGDNAEHWASLSPRLGNSNQCQQCHEDVDMKWSRSAHAGQSCEACHGAGDRHLEFGAIVPPMKELCTTCHEQTTGRPPSLATIVRIDHFPLDDCMTCHDPHAPAAAFPSIPHAVQGREDCLACHGVREIAALPPNHANRQVELCLGCHKRGEESR